jgi:hypothetical protein
MAISLSLLIASAGVFLLSFSKFRIDRRYKRARYFVGSVFDLPKTWKSREFKDLRRAYRECTECNYLCYIFYSLQGGPVGNISVALDQWRNAGLVIKKNN